MLSANVEDILIEFTLSKPVFRVFVEYLKCFKCFNNKMVQGNKTNIMFESKKGKHILVYKYKLNKFSNHFPFCFSHQNGCRLVFIYLLFYTLLASLPLLVGIFYIYYSVQALASSTLIGWLVCCLLAGPDLWKRMPLKCSITMVFTCPLLSWCTI